MKKTDFHAFKNKYNHTTSLGIDTNPHVNFPVVRQPIGSTAHWSDSPLVRQPIGSTAHWSDSPLDRQPISPTAH